MPAIQKVLIASGVLLTVFAAPGAEIKPTGKEIQAERIWLKQSLLRPESVRSERTQSSPLPLKAAEPGLDVWANNDAVIPNGRGKHPLKIGDREFTRGLYCHAVSKLDVHLPAPGKKFTAVAGLDHNDDTAKGRGSVIFKVTVNKKVAFQSEVMRFGTPGREVDVDLDGAEVFTLEIGDAGDGIGWDQSDWANAKVTVSDLRQSRRLVNCEPLKAD